MRKFININKKLDVLFGSYSEQLTKFDDWHNFFDLSNEKPDGLDEQINVKKFKNF